MLAHQKEYHNIVLGSNLSMAGCKGGAPVTQFFVLDFGATFVPSVIISHDNISLIFGAVVQEKVNTTK